LFVYGHHIFRVFAPLSLRPAFTLAKQILPWQLTNFSPMLDFPDLSVPANLGIIMPA
jgi:hypothetical protein